MNLYLYQIIQQNLYHSRRWSTLFLWPEHIYFTWYKSFFHLLPNDKFFIIFFLSFLTIIFSPLYFSLASHDGGCSGSKCSNVYNFEEDYSGIYDACRVCFGGAEVYTLCRFQVNGFLQFSSLHVQINICSHL